MLIITNKKNGLTKVVPAGTYKREDIAKMFEFYSANDSFMIEFIDEQK